jgi:hypothetical protein
VGYQILRVDARNAGTNAATFNENSVRGGCRKKSSKKEREKYLQTLRNEGYINIAVNYKKKLATLKDCPASGRSQKKIQRSLRVKVRSWASSPNRKRQRARAKRR